VAARDTLLHLAAELERRDREVAAALDRVQGLDARLERVRSRGDELRERVEGAPIQLAAIDRAHAEAVAAHADSRAELEAAELRLSDLERGRRVDAAALEHARRTLEHARELESDARRRVERLAAERVEQEEAVAAIRAEVPAVLEDAAEIAAEIDGIDRISDTGREPSPDALERLPEWTSKVHAALFVVRGQREQERDRLVREASELGGAALGEQLAGASVALVRKRLEKALRR
jgi:chromosome segregation ATPase